MRFATVVDGIGEGVIAVGTDHEILFINKSAKKMLRGIRNKEQLTGLIEESLERNKKILNSEISLNKDDQKISLNLSTSFMKDANGKIFAVIGIFTDISLIKQLKDELRTKKAFKSIVGHSHKMRKIYELLLEVSSTDSSVLIEGETGTGKELIASEIHNNSKRSNRPFVKVNCAALSEGLLESELFGHVKGSFTGAINDKPGRFQLADGGTLFLDEVGDIPLATQVKLLRALQDGTFERVGGTKTIKVNVRIIGATNKDLKEEVEKGRFREDLYYRLKVIPISVPPLRERKEDIPVLINHFVDKFNKKMNKEIDGFTPKAMTIMLEYNFPGNIRELEHIVEHAFVRCQSRIIEPSHLPREIHNADIIDKALSAEKPLKTLEREMILQILDDMGWKYQECAKRLAISRTTLWRKMKELKIEKK